MLSRNVCVKLAMYVLFHFSLSIFSHSNKSFIFVPLDKCSFKDLIMPSKPEILEYWQNARLDNGFLHRYSRTSCNEVRVENVSMFFISFIVLIPHVKIYRTNLGNAKKVLQTIVVILPSSFRRSISNTFEQLKKPRLVNLIYHRSSRMRRGRHT